MKQPNAANPDGRGAAEDEADDVALVDVDDPDDAVVVLSVETAPVDVEDLAEVVVELSVDHEVALADVDDAEVAVVEPAVATEEELELGTDDTNLAPKTPLYTGAPTCDFK